MFIVLFSIPKTDKRPLAKNIANLEGRVKVRYVTFV